MSNLIIIRNPRTPYTNTMAIAINETHLNPTTYFCTTCDAAKLKPLMMHPKYQPHP